MTPEQLVARHPKLFHMSESGSWQSIQQHGLLSTTALLDLFGVEGQERSRIETKWRGRGVSIQHPDYGIAVIRDQGPMPPHTLAPLLDGLTPADWYELINRKSFFWLAERKVRPDELFADTAYGSGRNAFEASRRGTELGEPGGGVGAGELARRRG